MAVHQRTTYSIDATGKVLGRLASDIAFHLRGKHKPTYTPNIDDGDVIEVTNVRAMVLTGQKIDRKAYHHFTRYPGGYKSVALKQLIEKKPAEVLRRAVEGMLPKNRLRSILRKRLIIR
ncbi:50S ribosomal protein L13 [Candidatus Uhrbacteria bacterium]|nr:50S ribosomal protein L13 [Candidatus Uhrbacteria bacterium]